MNFRVLGVLLCVGGLIAGMNFRIEEQSYTTAMAQASWASYSAASENDGRLVAGDTTAIKVREMKEDQAQAKQNKMLGFGLALLGLIIGIAANVPATTSGIKPEQ